MTPVSPDLAVLTLSELLQLIIAGRIGVEVVAKARERIKKLWLERKYGFTPDPELASDLQKISNKDVYRRLKECIGNHWSLDLIKLGLKVPELNDEGKRREVRIIFDEAFRKHGKKGNRIIEMGSTGVLTQVVDHLSQLKTRDEYNQEELASRFDKIIERWQQISLFCTSEDEAKDVSEKIKSLMGKKEEIFFVFAYGSASDTAIECIVEMKMGKRIRKGGYLVSLYSKKEDKAGSVSYTWVFDLLS